MNTERLEEIARWLEGGAPHAGVTFKMNTGISLDLSSLEELSVPAAAEAVNSCGTACCIAGAAVQFFGTDYTTVLIGYAEAALNRADDDDIADVLRWIDNEASWGDIREEAAELLGLDNNDLFYAKPFEMKDVDAAWAARTIRHLLATGEVDWVATKQENNDATD